MQLNNFTQRNHDTLKPSGPCEVGGRTAHCCFDRSDPKQATIAVRFSMEPAAPLPAFARDRAQLTVAGTAVPVSVVTLGDRAEALGGPIDPALVEAVLGPSAAPSVPGAGGPVPESLAGPTPAANPVTAKYEAWRAAQDALAEAGLSIRALTRTCRALRQQAAEAEEDLADAEASLPSLKAATADLGQQLQDAVNREVGVIS